MSDPVLTRTRLALHAVAEQVLAGFRHHHTGRIGLEVAVGGFATPVVPTPEGLVRASVLGTDLVIDREGELTTLPLTTLAAAAGALGITPGAPVGVYPAATVWGAEEPLAIDAAAAAELSEWFVIGERALRTFGASHLDLEPSPMWLWPEHFDLGFSMAEVNYGISPGDDGIPGPYAYVGPWNMDGLEGDFWNASFGASQTRAELPASEDLVVFFETGRRGALPG